MAKVKVEFDLSDILESITGDDIKEAIGDSIKDAVIAKVKRDPEYKQFVDKKTREMLLKSGVFDEKQ